MKLSKSDREVSMPTTLKFMPKIKMLNNYKYDALSDQTELMWRCSKCGQLRHRKDGLPDQCPSCRAPHREFALVEED
jgi:rubrerythrin